MVGPGEIARRARSRYSGRLESLPILALSVHSACNCRCVMCDIWKVKGRNELATEEVDGWMPELMELGVERVVLSGGEALVIGDAEGLAEGRRVEVVE